MSQLFHSVILVIVLSGLCSLALILSLLRRISKWGMSLKDILGPDGFSKAMWSVYLITATIAVPVLVNIRDTLNVDPSNPITPGLNVFLFLMLALYVAHMQQQDEAENNAYERLPKNPVCYVGAWGRWTFYDGSKEIENPYRRNHFWYPHVVSAFQARPVESKKGWSNRTLRGYLIVKSTGWCSPGQYERESAAVFARLEQLLSEVVNYTTGLDGVDFLGFAQPRDKELGLEVILDTVHIVPALEAPKPIEIYRRTPQTA